MSATAVNPDASNTSGKNAEFFRCPLPMERSKAVVRIGRKQVHVIVQEASIDGYTILVNASDAAKLQVGRPWRLFHEDATLEVLAQWFFQAPDGEVQIGLRRLSDLTPPPKIGGWFPSLTSKRGVHQNSTGTLLFGGTILATLLTLSLPGIGDSLGTAGRIQSGLSWVGSTIRATLAQWM